MSKCQEQCARVSEVVEDHESAQNHKNKLFPLCRLTSRAHFGHLPKKNDSEVFFFWALERNFVLSLG